MKSKILLSFVFLILFSTLAFGLDDAILYYSFDNDNISGANVYDDSANNNDGTNNGATTGQTGILEEAFLYDGSTDYVITSSGLGALSNASWGAWVDLDLSNNYDTIFDTATQGEILLALRNGEATPRVRCMFDGNVLDYTTTDGYVVSTTQDFYVCTYDGSTLKLFVNGVNVKNSSVSSASISSQVLNIGRQPASGNHLDGIIDESFVYDRALSTQEIEALYNEDAGCNPYKTLCLGTVNFTITATDNASSESILTFNATVNGTLYETTNGTIVTNIYTNSSALVNATVVAENYFDATYTNYNVSTTLEATLDPQELIDFSLLTPNNTKTNASTFNVTWTEAVSPTSKAVTYNVTVYNLSNDIEDTFTTTDLFYNLDISGYSANTYNVSVNAEENVTGKNYTHSSLLYVDKTNYLYFVDAVNSTALVGSNVTMYFSNGDEENYTTDSLGKIEFQSFRNFTYINGSTTLTYQDDQGYITPVNFTYNAPILPINYTYNISRANLTIKVIDTITGSLITEKVSISISDIGSFTTTNGTLFFEDITLVSQLYTIVASSDNYTYVQKEFTYTNQEELTVSLFVYDTRRDNIGTVYLQVYDSFRDIVVNADVRLQEFNFTTSSFVEVGSSSTNSKGESSFQVLLQGKTYRFLVTKVIGGTTYQEYSNVNGEIFFEDGYTVKVYLDTIIDTTEPYFDELVVTIDNISLINNISYHEASFIDSSGASHTVCLNYSYLNGVRELPITGTCVTGASGTLNALVAYDLTTYLNDTSVVVTVYVEGEETPRYRQVYAGELSFEKQFNDLIRPLILVSMICALALALYLRRIDYFIYLEVLISIIWSMVAPSYMSTSFVALNIVLGVMILYLAKKKTNANEI